jgi:hypothetical protein
MSFSDFATWVSLVSGVFTILGISGIFFWSLMRRERKEFNDKVLQIFSYSFKPSLCLLLLVFLFHFGWK